MLIDCHVHTRGRSACSILPPEEACRLARARGLDLLVFTEHHLRWDEEDLAALRALFPGLGLFSGMEVTLAEGYDVLLIGPGLPGHLPLGIPLDALLSRLGPLRRQIFVVLAHPFRYLDRVGPELTGVLARVDAIETCSVNILRPGFIRQGDDYAPTTAARYAAAATRFDLPEVFFSDAHRPEAVGAVASLAASAPLPADERELVALLRQGGLERRQSPHLLAQILGS